MNKNWYFRFRSKLMRKLCSSVPEGEVLPNWAICLNFIIFPIHSLGWLLTKPNHYDIYTDTYVIHGVRYSGKFLRTLASPNPDSYYRVYRIGDFVSTSEFRQNSM
ncbi:hypothetical protein EBR43_06675 [bacterium]|nr:hypothetical protein [bacterium]